MIRLEAKSLFIDEEHKTAVITVTTTRCFYQVAIKDDEVTIVGPGVEEKYWIGPDDGQIPQHLTHEGVAIIAVTMFEEDDE